MSGTVRRQTAVTDHLKSDRLPLFTLARHYTALQRQTAVTAHLQNELVCLFTAQTVVNGLNTTEEAV